MQRTHRTLLTLIALSSLLAGVAAPQLAAQRTFTLGAAVGRLTPRGGGAGHTGTSLTLGWLATSTSETQAFLSRWSDASFGTPQSGVTTFGLDSRYYPVEAGGIAPYFSTGIGVFKYHQPGGLLTSPSDQW
ncbi:MAG TPA: hypothetical protein VFI13_09410, partial [Gemmatimonadales bacterium]|nr:hypothetical protein [Gemmatimonadales bacterium]